MTLQEIRQQKNELEDKIFRLLEDFQKTTGITVKNISAVCSITATLGWRGPITGVEIDLGSI